jgi:class 3 adenylate cyclase/site-specific recombinase XerC
VAPDSSALQKAMNQLVPITTPRVPELVAAAGARAGIRFLEFFAANIRNPHTRRAYARAADEFLAWCAAAGVPSIGAVQPVHVATWIEAGTRELAAPSVKQRLAAIRHLFDWLVTGQVVPVNPAASVRGPRHVVTSGQTLVLDPSEARALLDSIDTSTVVGLRDRALIGLMVYSFARIGAALGMTVEDVFMQNRRPWVRLREKGGKRHAMTCHHNLEEYLTGYLDGAELRGDPKGPLFRTIGRNTGMLTRTVLPRANAGIATKLGNHSFRATGITAYLKNGGTLEKAAAMATAFKLKARIAVTSGLISASAKRGRENMPAVRRLAAILAADVAGYSRLMGADEEGTLDRLKGHRRQLIDPKITEHRGRIVKTTGDGMLVEFASVVDAVRCAAEFQRAMVDRDCELAEDRRVTFRVGINLGDIIVEDDDIFGDGVNVAARLEALAEPGGVCISGTVRDHVGDRLPYGFADMGEQSVRSEEHTSELQSLS